MISSDLNKFFLSNASLDKQSQREQKHSRLSAVGDQTSFPAKPLALCVDQSIYAALANGSVATVSPNNGSITATFRGHKGPVTAVCLADGFLFSGSWDKSIRKWNLQTGSLEATLEFHDDFVKALAAHGSTIYSASADKRIAKWDAVSGKHLATFSGHRRSVESLAVSGCGSFLFSCSSDSTIRKWDAQTGECLFVLEGHLTSVYAIVLNEDDTELFSASADKTARRWDLLTNKQIASYEHPDFVRSIALNERTGVFATGCRDENIRIYNLATDECMHVIQAHAGEVSALAFDNSGRLWSASLDCTIRSWSIDKQSIDQFNKSVTEKESPKIEPSLLTIEEEQELAELADL